MHFEEMPTLLEAYELSARKTWFQVYNVLTKKSSTNRHLSGYLVKAQATGLKTRAQLHSSHFTQFMEPVVWLMPFQTCAESSNFSDLCPWGSFLRPNSRLNYGTRALIYLTILSFCDGLGRFFAL